MNPRAASQGMGAAGGRQHLPLAAFVVVILALAALAIVPAVMLERIARVAREINEISLPAYDGLHDFALATERRASAARGLFLTRNPSYARRLEQARAAEAAALRGLRAVAPRLGPAAAGHLSALERHGAGMDSLERVVVASGAGLEAYRDALPGFDRRRDSIQAHLAALEQALVRATDLRLREEQRWASLQRVISLVLGPLAAVAALMIAWSARVQQRLRRRVQHALDEADRRREEVERVTESRARLMRGFGHDVKNPLGAAQGYLQLLDEGIVGPLSPEQRRSVARAAASITMALNLVEDLLDIARAESGHLEVAPAPADLCAVAADTAEAYRAQAAAKGLDLRVELPPERPRVTTDERRVRQVLGNLLSNAVKYTPSGQVAVRVTADGDRVGIAVADTGPGIPAAQRHLLFTEFVRLHEGPEKGAGMGLTISHRIARALGGEIVVDSEEGQGTTFTLWIPAGTP